MARYEEASNLYEEGFAFVNAVVGAIEEPSRAIFLHARLLRVLWIRSGGSAYSAHVGHRHGAAGLEESLHAPRDVSPSAGGAARRLRAMAQSRMVQGGNSLCDEPGCPIRSVRALARVPFTVRGMVAIGGKCTSMDRSGKAVSAPVDNGMRQSLVGSVSPLRCVVQVGVEI